MNFATLQNVDYLRPINQNQAHLHNSQMGLVMLIMTMIAYRQVNVTIWSEAIVEFGHIVLKVRTLHCT